MAPRATDESENTDEQSAASAPRWPLHHRPRLLIAIGAAVAASLGATAYGFAAASEPTSNTKDAVDETEAGATTEAPEGTSPGPDDSPAPSEKGRPETATTAPPATAAFESAVPPNQDEPTAAESRGWELVAEDDFTGPEVDTERWTLYDGPGNGGVGLRRPEAISQSDGTLKITGRGDVSGGMNWNGGRVYGRWEFRARSDAGNGYAPNILLWPTSGNWPAEGEINIMEIPWGRRDRSLFVIHWGEENNQVSHHVLGDFTEWNTFALEWLPTHLTLFVNGEEVYTDYNPEAIPRDPMQLSMQNDVGPHDGFIPPRDHTTPDEVSLEVDWVRIYAP